MRANTKAWINNRLGDTDKTPKYYVYEYADPITGNVFYVGKGNRLRYTLHLRDTKRGIMPNSNNGKLFRQIKGILDNGLEPLIYKVNENMPEIDALALEAACIDYYGLNNLCNYAQSGVGAVNHNDEVRKRISENTKAAMRQPAVQRKMFCLIAIKCGGFVSYFEKLYFKQCRNQRRYDRIERKRLNEFVTARKVKWSSV